MKLGKRFLPALLAAFAVHPLHAGIVELYYQQQLEKIESQTLLSSIQMAFFKQAIDHHNPDMGFFDQRYYFDSSYAESPQSPVFFYICGEAACHQSSLQGAVRLHAKKHHAYLIALEHRYYGKSQPRPSLSTADMAYLHTEAAIEDLYHFQKSMMKSKGLQGKWVAFGGSYPGSLSAFYRLRHPEMVVGALASSAPVKAKEDFFEYDAHVAEVAGQDCAAKMRLVADEAEAALARNPEHFAEIKAAFAATDVHHPLDFLYLIADVGAYAVQYGDHQRFCDKLSHSPNALDAYAAYARALFERLNLSARDFTFEAAMDEDPKSAENGVGIRQWAYQSCTEYGYWQTANPNRHLSTRSTKIDLAYHRQLCQRLFGLTAPADVDSSNAAFYWPLIYDASAIFFSNGANDPWSQLSLMPANGNAQNEALFYYLIQGAAHCEDLHAPKANDSQALIVAREAFDRQLSNWLEDAIHYET